MQGWRQMDAQSQAQVMALPRAWADLQQSWKTMDEAAREKKRTEWRDQILLPNNFFAPPAQIQRFTAQGNLLGFEYPAAWTGGWQVIQETPFLFVGPGGDQASWDRVLNTQSSPAGALFALVALDARMRQMNYVQGARVSRAAAYAGNGPEFPRGGRHAHRTGRSHHHTARQIPGRERGAVLLDRHHGVRRRSNLRRAPGWSVSEAMDLLPGFHYILSTLQVHPPQPAGGGGSAMGSWEVAWSKVSTAAVANIWK